MGAQVHHTNIADAQAEQKKLVCYHCGIACDLSEMRTERIEYLAKLGAHTRDDVKATGFVPAYQLVRKDKDGRNLPPVREQGGEVFRYRVEFTKLGTVAMTGHLDINRAMPRIARRAGLAMKYSDGFTPRAQVSFGPALALGISSVAELCDLYMRDDVEPSVLIERLNAVSDPGMRFLRAALVPAEAPTIAREAKVAEFILASAMFGDANIVETALMRACGNEPVMIDVTRKHGDKPIDVRDGLVSVEPSRLAPNEAAAFGLAPETPILRWRVNLGTGAHVRAPEFAEAILGTMPADLFVARTGLFALSGTGVRDLFSSAGDVREHERAARNHGAAEVFA
jgi:radical SAM-linked protein